MDMSIMHEITTGNRDISIIIKIIIDPTEQIILKAGPCSTTLAAGKVIEALPTQANATYIMRKTKVHPRNVNWGMRTIK